MLEQSINLIKIALHHFKVIINAFIEEENRNKEKLFQSKDMKVCELFFFFLIICNIILYWLYSTYMHGLRYIKFNYVKTIKLIYIPLQICSNEL